MRGEVIGLLASALIAGVAGLGGCTRTEVIAPPRGLEMLTYSAADPKIQVHATVLILPSKVLAGVPMNWTKEPSSRPAVPATQTPGAPVMSQSLGYAIVDKPAMVKFIESLRGNMRTLGNWEMNLALGQPATAGMTESQNYMKSFDMTAGPGGEQTVNYHPDTLTTGLTLELEGTISADGKSIITRVHPLYVKLDGMDTFSMKGGGPFVQIPKVSTVEVNTTITIPLGATYVFAAPRIISESMVESGIFKNRSYVREESTIVVIVRPEIKDISVKVAAAK